jgi:hypothetical protein
VSEEKITKSRATFGSIPRGVYEKAVAEVERFATLLVLEGKLAGSGTLVKCDNIYGILTAHHVVHNPKDRDRRFNFVGTQKLALLVEKRAHWFEIDLCACHCVDIGAPTGEDTGPDLSFIILPEARLGTLKAKKDFYNISAKTDEKLKKSLSDDGIFIFAGCPACNGEESISPQGVQNLFLPLMGACTSLEKRYEDGSFDFLELNVSYKQPSEAVESFAGVSGGGAWRIPLRKRLEDPIENVDFNEIILSGVAFYQTEIEGDRRRIRCHGGRSIFQRTIKALRASRR